MKRYFLAILCISLISLSYSNTRRYRLVINNDPSTSMTIAWEQDGGSGATVYYGATDFGTNFAMYPMAHGVDRTTTTKGMSNSFSRLTGLTPNTVYYFVINDSQGTSARYSFRTQPANSNTPLSLVCGGDSRIFTDNSARVNANDMVAKLRPDAVVFAGDFTWLDLDLEWESWFDDWQATIATDGRMTPIIPARGNHELSSQVLYGLFDVPSADEYFALTLGGNMMRLYTLNTEISLAGTQTNWLESDLISTGDNVEWKMAQYHQPIRSHVSSEPEGNNQYAAWADLFYDYGVRLVLESDSHDQKITWPIKPDNGPNNELGYVREDINGTVFMGEGTWGVPLRTNDDDKVWTKNSGSFNGVQWVHVRRDSIEIRFVNTDNASSVGSLTDGNRFDMPTNINIWNPSNGEVTYIVNEKYTGRPLVDVTYPFHLQYFGTPTNIDITADAVDTNGTVQYVEFFVNDVSIGTDNSAPYEYNWTMPADGSYTITAWAFDNDGYHNISDLVKIYAGDQNITAQINGSSDDAEEYKSDGSLDLTSTDLEMAVEEWVWPLDDENQWVGLRFNAIDIPVGSTVTSAYIEFTSDEGNSGSSSLIIYGEDADSPDTFSNSNKISTRTRTASSVSWSVADWSTDEVGPDTQTPDLSTIVQHLIDRPGWSPGNSMVFIIEGSGTRSAYSYDENTSKSAKLYINVSGPVSVDEQIENNLNWAIYPNPASDFVNVQLPNDVYQGRVDVLSVSGQLIVSEQITPFNKLVQFGGKLRAGNYIIRLTTNKGISTKKIIIQ